MPLKRLAITFAFLCPILFASAANAQNYLGEFTPDAGVIRCFRVYFRNGGQSNFCVPAGQNHRMQVQKGDSACFEDGQNRPVPEPCNRYPVRPAR